MRLILQRQKLASVMAWGGVTTTRLKTPLVFIEKDVKVNKDTYFIEGKLVVMDSFNIWRRWNYTSTRWSHFGHGKSCSKLVQEQYGPFLDKGNMPSFFHRFESHGLQCVEYT